jgi:hypothetical protein
MAESAALAQVLGVVYRSIARHLNSQNELQRLVKQIAEGVGQVLERRGLIERALENAWLASDNEAGPLDDLIGHSITYRIAVGPRAGQKLFTLQVVPPPRDVTMSRAKRLKRVFGIEIDTCQRCGGTPRIVASIEQPEVTAKSLAHLERTSPQRHQAGLPLGGPGAAGGVALIGSRGGQRERARAAGSGSTYGPSRE